VALALVAALGLSGPAAVGADDPGGGGHGGGPGQGPAGGPNGHGPGGANGGNNGASGGGNGGNGHNSPAGAGIGGGPSIGGVVSPFPAPSPGRGHGGGGDGGHGGGPGPPSLSQSQGSGQSGRQRASGDGQDGDGDQNSGGGKDSHGGSGDSGRDDGGDGGELTTTVQAAASAATAALTHARQQQAQTLIRTHPEIVEPDNLGRPVVRRQILALAPSPTGLAAARRAGFKVGASDTLTDLGVTSAVLTAPRGMSAVQALDRMRALDPSGQYDFNHLYQQGGLIGAPVLVAAAPKAAAAVPAGRRIRVGLVDGGVAPGQPALQGVAIEERGFAAGGPKPSAHGTAVASLIAGRRGVFRGAAPGAALFVADVYGATPAGGSADAIAHGLAWIAQSGSAVINISLVGPPNILLEAAVKALIARGHILVAAVGNDGPAAAPLYPASYPGVIAVTAVDPNWRLLPEAGRGTHVDFAAPGSEMAAAGMDGGFVSVRGTSFAAPLTAGLLARLISEPDRAAADRAIAALGRRAMDLGPRGPDKLYGRGLVAVEYRTPPGEVRASAALRGP
jgi:hypothetical protein